MGKCTLNFRKNIQIKNKPTYVGILITTDDKGVGT